MGGERVRELLVLRLLSLHNLTPGERATLDTVKRQGHNGQ